MGYVPFTTKFEEKNLRAGARIQIDFELKEIKTIIGQIGIMSLIGLITLLTLVSCGGGGSAEDDLTAPPVVAANAEMVPITFSGSEGVEATVTRAEGTPLYVSAQQFKVWGHKDMKYDAGVYSEMQTVFPGYTVSWVTNTAYTTTSNTNDWEYVGGGQTIKFWDWSAKAYRFFAVTDWGTSSGAGGTYGPSDIYQSYNISMPADCSGTTKDEIAANIAATPYFSHLWFSTGDPVAYADKQFGKPVVLEFLKPLTRVRYIFKYVYPREGYFLTNKSFKPSDDTKNIARKGTVTISYPLNGTDTKESFTVTADASEGYLTEFDEDYDPEDDGKNYVTLSSGAMTSDGWYIVAPNMSQGSYKLSVYINGVEKTAAVPANYMSWLPGYSYTYVFKITEEGGVEIGWVEAAVIPWIEQEADHPVYNW